MEYKDNYLTNVDDPESEEELNLFNEEDDDEPKELDFYDESFVPPPEFFPEEE